MERNLSRHSLLCLRSGTRPCRPKSCSLMLRTTGCSSEGRCRAILQSGKKACYFEKAGKMRVSKQSTKTVLKPALPEKVAPLAWRCYRVKLYTALRNLLGRQRGPVVPPTLEPGMIGGLLTAHSPRRIAPLPRLTLACVQKGLPLGSTSCLLHWVIGGKVAFCCKGFPAVRRSHARHGTPFGAPTGEFLYV